MCSRTLTARRAYAPAQSCVSNGSLTWSAAAPEYSPGPFRRHRARRPRSSIHISARQRASLETFRLEVGQPGPCTCRSWPAFRPGRPCTQLGRPREKQRNQPHRASSCCRCPCPRRCNPRASRCPCASPVQSPRKAGGRRCQKCSCMTIEHVRGAGEAEEAAVFRGEPPPETQTSAWREGAPMRLVPAVLRCNPANDPTCRRAR